MIVRVDIGVTTVDRQGKVHVLGHIVAVAISLYVTITKIILAKSLKLAK